MAGRRRTFCSEACVHEWKLRSNPHYLRVQVFRRDRGICASCGLDTRKVRRLINRARKHSSGEYRSTLAVLTEQGFGARVLWHADHIVPVVEGGGECGLENLRTLCVPCHRATTSALRARRRKPLPPAEADP